jgi:hypothetical protein
MRNRRGRQAIEGPKKSVYVEPNELSLIWEAKGNSHLGNPHRAIAAKENG